jgi:drug/metabolite transporter (DMT)-like permease
LSTLPLLAISMASHWFYQACLIRAMHRGDLSLVYPVMRGLGPLATAVFATFLLQEHLAPMQQIGLFCASFAILFFALPTAATREGRSLDRRALFWAVLTAVGIGLYAVSDTRAARAMPHPMTFVIILFLVDWIGVTLVFLWQRRGRYMQTIRPQLRSGVIGGIVGCLSYGMAIFAYTMTDAAMVTALAGDLRRLRGHHGGRVPEREFRCPAHRRGLGSRHRSGPDAGRRSVRLAVCDISCDSGFNKTASTDGA